MSGLRPWTLHLRKLLDKINQQLPAVAWKTAKLVAAVLLARPLKAANPDAKHPGKAGKIPGRKRAFSWGLFLGFLWARSPHSFVSPATGGSSLVFPNKSFRLTGSRGRRPLVQGFRGPKRPPASSHTAFSSVIATVISPASLQAASIFSLRGWTTISPGVRIIFLRLERGLPSA